MVRAEQEHPASGSPRRAALLGSCFQAGIALRGVRDSCWAQQGGCQNWLPSGTAPASKSSIAGQKPYSGLEPPGLEGSAPCPTAHNTCCPLAGCVDTSARKRLESQDDPDGLGHCESRTSELYRKFTRRKQAGEREDTS